MKSLAVLLALVSVAFANNSGPAATFQPAGVPFKTPVTFGPAVVGYVVFSGLTQPRGVTADPKDNLLVVERGIGVSGFNAVTSPKAGWQRSVVLKNKDLTHGIQADNSFLYVSTSTEVLAYLYNPATKSVILDHPFRLITNIPGDGLVDTHTLQLEKDASGATTAILIGSGPGSNIDRTAGNPTKGRSQIRRFPLPWYQVYLSTLSPLKWSSGQVVAYGLRNPSGFAFHNDNSTTDGSKTLYVVDSSASIDAVAGLTPTFVKSNPADEVNRVSYIPGRDTPAPKSYGYPDCTTLWNTTVDPRVTQYKSLKSGDQFSLKLDPLRNDKWCENSANNVPPFLALQAHYGVTDIVWNDRNTTLLPKVTLGEALVSVEGSFSGSSSVGYGVLHVPIPFSEGPYHYIIHPPDFSVCPGKCISPVGLTLHNDGRLYVTSVSTGELFSIEKNAWTE